MNRYISLFILLLVISPALLSACAAKQQGPVVNKNAEDPSQLLVVDCLLPGQIRRLGRLTTYVTPRRPVKTTASDCEIRGGEYVAADRADYRQALNVWLPLAEAGDPKAQTFVGEIYEKGLGAAPDCKSAARWYRLAAGQDYPRACLNLASLYETGCGVDADQGLALEWYRRGLGLTEGIVLEYEQEVIARKNEIANLKQELEQARTDSKNLSDQLNRSRMELEKLEQKLKKEQAAGHAAKAAEKDTALRHSLENQKNLRARADELKKKIAKHLAMLTREREKTKLLTGRISGLETKLAEAESRPVPAKALAGPSIVILEPSAQLATRGINVIQVAKSASSQEVVGKVSAPAGLKSLKLGGYEITPEADGFFTVTVPVPGPGEPPLALAAVDANGRQTSVNLILSSNLRALKHESTPAAKAVQRINADVAGFLGPGENYALIIGNNKYVHLPELATAVNDADDLAEVLVDDYDFQTTVLANADRYEILSAIHQFSDMLTANDNLLVYYAGHGEIDPATGRGYWLPVNAEPANMANWISVEDISALLSTFKAKRIMVIADSCYSGTMSSSAIAGADDSLDDTDYRERIKQAAARKSCTVLTSGGMEPVLDVGGGTNSIFARALISALKANTSVLEGKRLYRRVSAQVAHSAASYGFTQVPEYSAIKHSGHQGGDFFFVPKNVNAH